jgi:hypothetical protein
LDLTPDKHQTFIHLDIPASNLGLFVIRAVTECLYKDLDQVVAASDRETLEEAELVLSSVRCI